MLVKIKRQKSPESEAYWQSFIYDGPGHVTVSALLDVLNYTDDLFDAEGNPATRIRWEPLHLTETTNPNRSQVHL